jgi:hypothetical protein
MKQVPLKILSIYTNGKSYVVEIYQKNKGRKGVEEYPIIVDGQSVMMTQVHGQEWQAKNISSELKDKIAYEIETGLF